MKPGDSNLRAGGWAAPGRAKEQHGVSSGARANEQDNTSGTDGSRVLDETSGGYVTRKSDGDIGGGRFTDGTRASRWLDGTSMEGKDSNVGSLDLWTIRQ